MSQATGKRTAEDAVLAYNAQRSSYVEYALKLSGLFQELLTQETITFHAVEQRAKSTESLREKLVRPGKSYQNGLAEITDLCGLRIITYSLDDVSRVCDLVHREFKVVPEHTVDKAAILAPAEFGYRSRHFVAELGTSRSDLVEWKRFRGILAEIQVRTVLEHAWAAMDHSLRYKREADVPREQKRALFRLSALLELADESFDALRLQQRVIRQDAQDRLSSADDNTLELNSLSYSAYAESSPALRDLAKLAYAAGFQTPDDDESSEERRGSSISELIAIAQAQGLHTIRDLDRVIQEEKARARSYFEELSAGEHWQISDSFAALLCLVRRDRSTTIEVLLANGFNSEIADRVLAVAARHRTAA